MLECRGIDYMAAREPHRFGVRILGGRRLEGPDMFADPLCPWQRRPLLLTHCLLLVTAQPANRGETVRLRCTKSMLWSRVVYHVIGRNSKTLINQAPVGNG